VNHHYRVVVKAFRTISDVNLMR